MKRLLIASFFFLSMHLFAVGQTHKEQLLTTDLGWGKALLSSDMTFLENLLANEFIWVHNHASMIDGKEQAIASAKRLQTGQADDTRNRTS
jgi:hypothetical protein